jgi:hypothetical protein
MFCQPNGTIGNQSVNVVTNYLKAHPEKLTNNASKLVIEAYSEAWPCEKSLSEILKNLPFQKKVR